MCPGMIPILHLPGEIIPGQFGPMSRVDLSLKYSFTLIMSSVGIPSVMQTTTGIPASAASIGISGKLRRHIDHARIRACFLHGIGHRIENRNPFMRRATFSRRHATDDIRPILHHLLSMKRPFLPVIPCTTRRVDLSTSTLNDDCSSTIRI